MRINNYSLAAVTVGATMMSFASFAAELAAGTVISASNLDQVKNLTFEGHRVGDMLPGRLEWMVREKGLTIKVRHSEPIEMDKKYMEATQKGKGTVKFDPATREMSGWVAGMPFDPQDINPKDPSAGDKLIWNLRAHQCCIECCRESNGVWK